MRYLERLETVDVHGRRYATIGVGNVVGRGRSVMLIVTICLGMLGYISPSQQYPKNSFGPSASSTAEVQPIALEPTVAHTWPTPPTGPMFVLPADRLASLVRQHGGALEDHRLSVVRAIGQRLSSVLQTPTAVQFDVLADTTTPAGYVFSSGNLLLTAALVDRVANQDQLAAALARQLEALLESRGAAQVTAEQLLVVAGYPVAALAEFDQRWDAWHIERRGPNVLATHTEPATASAGHLVR